MHQMFLSQRLIRRFYLKASMNFFRRWRLKDHVYQQSLQQRSGRWPFSDLAFVLKNLHSPCMFCWFCLSKSQIYFPFPHLYQFWIFVKNVFDYDISLLNFVEYFTMNDCYSNEKQIQVCLEPLPGQRNQIVWDLFSWFWSKSGFWLSIILRRS